MPSSQSTPSSVDIKPLILLGGLSSRFVNPTQNKAFLPIPQSSSSEHPSSAASDSVTLALYQHILTLLQSHLPSPYSALFSSLLLSIPATRDPATLPPLAPQLSSSSIPIQFLPDLSDKASVGLSTEGPSLGLLTAHAQHPSSHLLVIAVDFPLLQPETITRLIDNYIDNISSSGDVRSDKSAVSAYLHPSDSFPEPLLSIWSPVALDLLKVNCAEHGRTGPCSTLKQIWKEEEEQAAAAGESERRVGSERWGVRSTEDDDEEKKEWWLAGCNDWEEWKVCQGLMMGGREGEEGEGEKGAVERRRKEWREPRKVKKKKDKKMEGEGKSADVDTKKEKEKSVI